MTRYIDADALKEYIDCGHLRDPGELCFSEIDVVELIDAQPTIDPEPVKRGKWLWVDGVRCSQCNYKLQTTGLPSYCPHCGADMRGEESKPPQVNPEMVKALLDRIEDQRGVFMYAEKAISQEIEAWNKRVEWIGKKNDRQR